MMQERLSAATYIKGILEADTVLLSRAITIIESTRTEDQQLAQEVLSQLLPHTGRAIRIGITGIPGVGKSTFIETFGQYLTSLGKRIAVLAVDPTSRKTGGSILGDKTRMEQLSKNPLAFIRPSPAAHALGGVTHSTRDTMLLFDAAGFELIFVETVGVGQSEMMVLGMTDFFLLLTIAGAGDELQGIKRGLMEMVDAVIVNKSDGDRMQASLQAASEYRNAMHLLPPSDSGVAPQVLTCSALEGSGMSEIKDLIESFVSQTKANGFFEQNRKNQQIDALHDLVQHQLLNAFYGNAAVNQVLQETEQQILSGNSLPQEAAALLMQTFLASFKTYE